MLAVGAVVVNDGSLLMVRRGKEPGKGLWSIPGGRVEPNELLVDAVVREVKEETSLDVEVVELLGILEVPGEPHYVILDHVAVVKGDTEPTAGDDADEVKWVALEEVESLETTPRFAESLRGWGILT